MNKKLLTLAFSVFLLVITIQLVQSAEWDNALTYSNNDLTIELKNWCIPFTSICLGKDYGSAELKSHPTINYVKKVGTGNQVVMWYDFNFNKEYVGGLGKVTFINQHSGEELNRSYEFVYWKEETYEEPIYSCPDTFNDINDCKKLGATIKTKGEWLPYNSLDIPQGGIRIGLRTFVHDTDLVDGIWEIGGKKVNKHAVWTGSLTTNLVLYYKLDEFAGVNVSDSGDFNFNATVNNSRVFTSQIAGIVNTSADFTQEHDLINRSNLSAIDVGKEYSVSLWVNASVLTGVFVAFGETSGDLNTLGIGVHNSRFYVFSYNGTVSANKTVRHSDDTVTANQYYHIVLVHYSDNTFDYYLNNTKQTASILSTGQAGGGPGTMTIGSKGLSNYWDGTVDEVAIWNRTLTPGEVDDLWNSGFGCQIEDLNCSTSLKIELLNPANNTKTFSRLVNFSVNVTDVLDGVTLSNVTFSVYNDSGLVYNDTNLSGFETSYQWNLTFADYPSTYNWTIIAYDTANKKYITDNATYVFDVVDVINNSFDFNITTFETSTEIFTLNITTVQDFIPTSPYFTYSGTNYTVDLTNGNNYYILKSTVPVPMGVQNNTFNFSYKINSALSTSSSFGQNVSLTYFSICNSTYVTPYVNFTFKNETTNLEDVNATFSGTFVYSLSSISSINKTFIYANTTEQTPYSFCFTPNQSVNVDSSGVYSNSYSQQRSWSLTTILTNTTVLQQLLYLLPTSLGLFSPFQAVDTLGNAISTVKAVITRTIGINTVTVATGYTDDSGFITFFLNPDFSYTGTFSKTGYQTFSFSFTPTADTRTVTLGGGGGTVGNGTMISANTTYVITPLNSTLSNSTTYTFGFNVTSGEDITFISMNITDGSSSYLYQTSAGQGYISGNVNTSQNTTIIGYYTIQTNDENLSITKVWVIGDFFVGDYSIYRQLTLALRYDFSQFLRMALVLLAIIGVMIYMNDRNIVDTQESMIGVALLLVWGFSLVGWLDTGIVVSTANTNINSLGAFSNKYGIAIISTAGGIYFILKKIFT